MSDPKRDFAEEVVRRLVDEGHTALWAGGCVRDFLLGRRPKDYDVATSAKPDEVRRVFGPRRTLSVGESFGVIVVLGPKEAGQIEVATFRTDGSYADGRRPDSVEFSTPELDAQRRDFTINGMFYDPQRQRVLDFVGGERDLAAGIIRAIGRPQARMEEDKLRMLRAVRFAATFDFQLDEVTADAVREMAGQLPVVSAERIGQELRRMLVDPHRHRALQLCREVSLLPQVFPELSSVTDCDEDWQRLLSRLRLLTGPDSLDGPATSPDFPLALAAVLTGIADQKCLTSAEVKSLVSACGSRLRLSNEETSAAEWLMLHRDTLQNASERTAAELKRTLAQPLARDLIELMRVRSLANGQPPLDAIFCAEYLRNTASEVLNPPPLISGHDLIQAGLRPGPRFKQMLDTIRDAQLNGEIATREEALALAGRLMP